jgi:hypothetical protein
VSIYSYQYDYDIKRLRTFVDRSEGIQWYTRNNVYPQIVEGVRDRSYTIKGCCEALGNFLAGEGFEDEAIGNMIVNSKGDTMNDILRKLRIDAATFSGAFVNHLGVNMLGEFNNLQIWPLSHWRLGLPTEDGDVYDVKYNSNWEQDPYKEINNAKRIIEYPKFNPDKDVILAQIEEWGLEYPGMVYYVSQLEDQYNLATFDSVLDQGQTQEEIGLFRLKSIQNGLNAGAIFSYPGTFEDSTKEKQFKDGLNEFTGAKGANSIMVIEDPSGLKKAADLVTPLTVTDHDKVHEFISRDDKNAIIEAFKMPKGILGVLPETGMFNQQQLQEEYLYYNTITRPMRQEISRAFKKIFSNWHQPVNSDFKIKELQYGTATVKPVNG